MTDAPRDLSISADRLLGRLAELASIGAIEGTKGCGRLAFTDEDKAGRDLVTTWMRDLGMTVSVDGIGNTIAVWGGPFTDMTLAPVMTGSHIDTVRTGGRYDGNLGVLAGLEVIETLASAGVSPKRPIAVAFFSNEEGARFPPDMMGSLVYVGAMTVEEALSVEDIEGTSVGEALDHIGLRGTAPAPGPVPHAFVELHIEQGPVLERTGFTIGAVTGVQGISWSELTITGQSNHAGTTPISMRHDPGLVAAKVAVFVRELADELGAPLVGTVGQIVLHPNLVNVVAATATMTIDLRHTDENTLQIAEKRVADFVAQAAAGEGVDVAWRSLARFEPVRFADDMVALVEQTASQLGYSHTTLPSGAGHDAQMLARVAPTAMIFTPSHNGLSHNPAEHTDPADIEAGANVLLHVLYKLAEDPT